MGEVAAAPTPEPAAVIPPATALDPATGHAAVAAAVAVIDLLDRDGHPRQTFTVPAWPLRIGRALDNDIVLGDPHVASHHLTIGPDASGLLLRVGDTRNGVALGRKRLASGATTPLAAEGEPIDLMLGRTPLRLRLPGHALAPELALAPDAPLGRRLGSLLLAAVLLIAGTLFTTYLETDPDGLARAAGRALLAGLLGAAVWCTSWALLSKTFTRQARFGWHLRVFLYASLALLAVGALPALLAFAFSWPWLTDFDFVGAIVVIATALYFHLLAVEPARHRLLKWAAATCAVVGVAVSVWFNVQRGDQFGDELYMSHLFPPALRLARPVAVDPFVSGLAPLQATLDKKAREPGRGDDGPRGDDE
jgi:hypothetical protein